jgi:prepilin peptidase CpaA
MSLPLGTALPAAVVIAGCLAASWTDATARRIPHAVPLAIAAAYPVFALAGGTGAPWWAGPAVAAAVFALGLGVFAAGWLGGGDVKLAAALALWAGPAGVAAFVLVTALAGAGLSLAVLALRRVSVPYLSSSALVIGPQTGGRRAAEGVPYGVAIAAGGLWIAYRALAG